MTGRGALATKVTAVAIGLVLATCARWIKWRFEHDMTLAMARVVQGGRLVETSCGVIEYEEDGSGIPLLAVHGSGGGYDQGMAFARPLTQRGIRVIAMSRFGYLRTPMRLPREVPLWVGSGHR